jgi:hypothetical protein
MPEVGVEAASSSMLLILNTIVNRSAQMVMAPAVSGSFRAAVPRR